MSSHHIVVHILISLTFFVFFHLVKMDEEKIDISLIQRFRSGISVDKKSKKKVLAIFKYLTGKESPIEAVELTVRRDQNLREAQLKVMYEMVKLVEDPPTLVRNDCFSSLSFTIIPCF